MEMVENQALEQRYPELEEKEDFRISVAMEEHRKYVSWDNYQDIIMVNYLRWDVHMKQKEDFIKREFLVTVTHPKGGGVVWTCAEDNIIEEKQEYREIVLHGFYYKLFEEEEV